MHELFQRARTSVIEAAAESPRIGPQRAAGAQAFRLGVALAAAGVFALASAGSAQAQDVTVAAMAPHVMQVGAGASLSADSPGLGQKIAGRQDVGLDSAASFNPVIAAALNKHRVTPAARSADLIALGEGLAETVRFDVEWAQAGVRIKAADVVTAVKVFEFRATQYEEAAGTWFSGAAQKADTARRLAQAANGVEVAIKEFFVAHNEVAAKGMDPGDHVLKVSAVTEALSGHPTWGRAKLEAAKAAPGL